MSEKYCRNKRNTVVLKFVIDKETGCWNVVDRAIHHTGYPRCKLDGRSVSAARYVYEMSIGDIPEGNVIRNKCDNPHCINPNHLETGTQLENISDMVVRGKPGIAKLTVEDVSYIRRCLHDDKSLADMFDVSEETIFKIRTYQSWKEVA